MKEKKHSGKVRVDTTIPYETWDAAKNKNISWSYALCKGIHILLKGDDILQKLNELTAMNDKLLTKIHETKMREIQIDEKCRQLEINVQKIKRGA